MSSCSMFWNIDKQKIIDFSAHSTFKQRWFEELPSKTIEGLIILKLKEPISLNKLYQKFNMIWEELKQRKKNNPLVYRFNAEEIILYFLKHSCTKNVHTNSHTHWHSHTDLIFSIYLQISYLYVRTTCYLFSINLMETYIYTNA